MDSARTTQWIQFLDKNLPHNADVIADLLMTDGEGRRRYPMASTLFWQSWARVDAKGGLAFILREQDSDKRAFEMATLMKAWVVVDPVGAAGGFAALEGSPLAPSALMGMANGFSGSSNAAATDFATWLPDKLRSEAAATIAGRQMLLLKIDGAQAWFDALPSHTGPFYRREALRAVLAKMSPVCIPGTVEKFVTQRLNEPWSHSPAEQIVAASAILSSGGSPWDYVSKVIGKYPNRENPLELVVAVADLDFQSAITWVNAHPGDPASDTILAGAVFIRRQRGMLEEAAALRERIRDPALRDLAEGKQVVEER
ncbi:MAG TPA: hypothetical protein VGE67_20330 [Haloferula sp.]